MSRSGSLGHLVRSGLLSVVAQALLIDFLMCRSSLSLLVMSMVIVSGRSRLSMVEPHTGTQLRRRLLMKEFTSRARCMPL
jgi:hypothetical protein